MNNPAVYSLNKNIECFYNSKLISKTWKTLTIHLYTLNRYIQPSYRLSLRKIEDTIYIIMIEVLENSISFVLAKQHYLFIYYHIMLNILAFYYIFITFFFVFLCYRLDMWKKCVLRIGIKLNFMNVKIYNIGCTKHNIQKKHKQNT